jgi:hypothetical protein
MTCIAISTMYRRVDQVHIPNPFVPSWFGRQSNAWDRRMVYTRGDDARTVGAERCRPDPIGVAFERAHRGASLYGPGDSR